jgi:hypothetical protein
MRASRPACYLRGRQNRNSKDAMKKRPWLPGQKSHPLPLLQPSTTKQEVCSDSSRIVKAVNLITLDFPSGLI